MIKTKNFLIIESPLDKLFPFSNRYALQGTNDTLYNVFDLTGKGGKYIAHITEHNSLDITPVAAISAPTNEEVEILQNLRALKPKIVLEENYVYLEPRVRAEPLPNLSVIEQRNHRLETLLASFNWLQSAHLLFYRDRLVFTNQKPFFYITIEHSRNPLSASESQKALFVEYEIYEHHFRQLREEVVSLHNIHPGNTTNLFLKYQQGQGLV